MTQSEGNGISNEAQFRVELMQAVPFLRAFARVLCGQVEQGNELSQEAVSEAWERRATFAPGSNLKAWLFKILRNNYYARRGREWNGVTLSHEFEPPQGDDGDQPTAVELKELARALGALSDEQREALILVGASGFAYKEAAAICDCAVGTIKSRVARARNALYQVLNETGERDQTVDDGDLAGGSLAPDAAFVPAAEMNKAVLYARRLMGASRRIH